MNPAAGGSPGSSSRPDNGRGPLRRAPGRLIAIILAVVLLGAHLFWFRSHIVDDAFITFRYARHLAEGEGAVFNRGEPVEGYTDFLWMLALAGADLAGLDLPRTAVGLGAIFSLGTLLLLALLPWPGIPRETAAAGAVLLASCGSFVLWGKSGLETGLFSFWLVLACWLFLAGRNDGRRAIRRDLALSCALGLAVLTRPEGIVLFGLLLALRLTERRLRPVAPDLALVAPALVLVGGQIAFRLASYGAFLPNTFHAKVGWSAGQLGTGLAYIAEAVAAYGPLLAVASLSALLFAGTQRTVLVLALVVALYGAAFVWEGGDDFPLLRFFAPLMPLLCLLAAHGLRSLFATRPALRQSVAVGALAVVTAVPSFHGPGHDRVVHDTQDVELWTELGRHLGRTLGPDDSVALNPVGAVGFYCGCRIIDMLGINDPVIARSASFGGPAGHRHADAAYVLSRRPTLILIGWNHPLAEGEQWPRLEPVYASDEQLMEHPGLRRDYEPVILETWAHRFAALRRRARPGG